MTRRVEIGYEYEGDKDSKLRHKQTEDCYIDTFHNHVVSLYSLFGLCFIDEKFSAEVHLHLFGIRWPISDWLDCASNWRLTVVSVGIWVYIKS